MVFYFSAAVNYSEVSRESKKNTGVHLLRTIAARAAERTFHRRLQQRRNSEENSQRM